MTFVKKNNHNLKAPVNAQLGLVGITGALARYLRAVRTGGVSDVV